MASLAIDSFPGTVLPNPLISELSTLYAAAGIDIPLTEELAAYIFMGRFQPSSLARLRSPPSSYKRRSMSGTTASTSQRCSPSRRNGPGGDSGVAGSAVANVSLHRSRLRPCVSEGSPQETGGPWPATA